MCFVINDRCPCCQNFYDWSIEAFEVAVQDGTIGKYFAHCGWCLERFHAMKVIENGQIMHACT